MTFEAVIAKHLALCGPIITPAPRAQSLLDRLQPQILALTSQSSEPITVFIDSNGGNSFVCKRILTFLNSCPIITVACGNAESAAADLLSMGDWTIAEPGSRLLYHETSVLSSERITAERATLLEQAQARIKPEPA